MSSEAITRAGALYCGEFESFDPMTVEVESDGFGGELVRTVRRARECLKGRTNDEVRAIAELSDHLISLDVLEGRVIAQHSDGTDESITMETVRDVDERGLLKLVCATVPTMIADREGRTLDINASANSGDVIEINRLTPSDILAVHGLVQCVRATDALGARGLLQEADDEPGARGPDPIAGRLVVEAFTHIVIAAECVAVAELDYFKVSSETKAVAMKDSATAAANARWSKLTPVRDRAVEIWRTGTWDSRIAAARAMKQEIVLLAEKAGIRLSDQNAVDTIDGWLRKSS